MGKKVLTVDLNRCTGCRSCEVWCSFRKYRQCIPENANIRVVKMDRLGIHTPIFCLQCEEPFCREICPTHALSFDSQGYLTWNKERCVGCHACLLACPFGAIWASPDKEIARCDLCKGDPSCVRHCDAGALSYTAVSEIENRKNVLLAKKLAKQLE